MNINQEFLYLIDAWQRGADADDYASEIATLRQAIEQAKKQEPVAWWNGLGIGPVFGISRNTPGIGGKDVVALYTAPPKRKWFGLTDEEIDYLEDAIDPAMYRVFARRIEAKLREKNNG
jgi:hypothetical protein